MGEASLPALSRAAKEKERDRESVVVVTPGRHKRFAYLQTTWKYTCK